MNDCRELSREDLFLWLSGALEGDEERRVADHAADCRVCEAAVAEELERTAQLASCLVPEEPPAAVKGRLMARVVGETLPDAARRASFRRRLDRARLRQAAIAAGLVAAVGLGFLATRWLSPPWSVPAKQYASLESDYEAVLGVREREIRMLRNRLQSTSHSAQATQLWEIYDAEGISVGSIVCVKRHLNCYVEVEGIERMGPNRVYALWLETSDGSLVSLGSFDANTSGVAEFYTYGARELADARDLVVTVEPWEMGTKPRGPVVFASGR